MITTKEVTYTKTITTWHCDFCDYDSQDNKGCCGVRPVMTCHICGKHVCRVCRNWYSENNSDYADAIVCIECDTEFAPAWEWALYSAERSEDIVEATIVRMKEERDG